MQVLLAGVAGLGRTLQREIQLSNHFNVDKNQKSTARENRTAHDWLIILQRFLDTIFVSLGWVIFGSQELHRQVSRAALFYCSAYEK